MAEPGSQPESLIPDQCSFQCSLTPSPKKSFSLEIKQNGFVLILGGVWINAQWNLGSKL